MSENKDWLASARSVFSDYATSVIEVGDTARQKALGAALGIEYGVGYAAAKARDAADIATTKIAESAVGLGYGLSEARKVALREAEETVVGLGYGITEGRKLLVGTAGTVGGAAKDVLTGAVENVGGAVGGVKDWFSSAKFQLLIPIAIITFILVMVSVGYSGLGGPAARVAEKEYGKRR